MHHLRALLAALLVTCASTSAAAQQRPAATAPGTVLFVCEHGTVKSLLAKLLFDEYAAEVGLPMRAESRGTAVDSAVPPWMRARLDESPLRFDGFRPRALAAPDLAMADLVVTFDLPPAVVAGAPAPAVRWDSMPAASQRFEASRDAIKARVRALVDSLNRERLARRP
jgi:arsenate reductase